ncbi:MAG: tetratricopeptide repeat protein [Saprospiraceae bacterium]
MAKEKKSKKKTSSSTPKQKATSVARNRSSYFSNKRLHCAVIFLLGFVLYGNTLSHSYTQDDAIVIYDNMFTTQGIAGIPGILKYDTFYGFFKEKGKDNLVSGGRYRPLSLVMFAVEYSIFGESPAIGHFMNILMYGLTGIILYLVLLQLLVPETNRIYAFSVALLTTLIFMAHPIHTEVVANIKGRDEILTLLCSLGAVYFSLRAFFEKNLRFNFLAGILFFLGLMSKENAITFLAVVPLAYYIFTKADRETVIEQMVPFIGATVLFLGIRTLILGFSFGDPPMELMNNPFVKIVGNEYVLCSPLEKFATIIFTLGKYIQLLIVPHPLTHDYYPRHIELMSFGDWQVILSLLLYIGLAIYAVKGLKRKDPLAFGIIVYLATLSIVSNIVFPVGTNMAERFAFMPSVGFSFCSAILLYRLGLRLKGLKQFGRFDQLNLVWGITAILLIAFSVKTVGRNAAWKDNFTLFMTDIETSKNSAKLRNAVGGELATQSVEVTDQAQKTKMLRDAIGHLEEALKIHPTYKGTYLQLGNCYHYLKQYEKGLTYYEKAIQLDPNFRDAIRNLAVTYTNMSQYVKAEERYRQLAALGVSPAELNPQLSFTFEEAGKYYGSKNQHAQAIAYFKKALKLATEKSEQAKFTYFIGLAYAQQKNVLEAEKQFQRALSFTEQEQNKAHIYRSLAILYKEAGEIEKQEQFLQLYQRAGGK